MERERRERRAASPKEKEKDRRARARKETTCLQPTRQLPQKPSNLRSHRPPSEPTWSSDAWYSWENDWYDHTDYTEDAW